ncbi:MAG: holo-ACP synthase [Pseudomonadota bacterium]
MISNDDLKDWADALPAHHILGIGTDICSVARIEKIYHRFTEHFLRKSYSKNEQSFFYTLPDHKKSLFLAKRFAAKEAYAKAFGTGLGAYVAMKEIETLNDTIKKSPRMMIYGQSLHHLQEKCHGHDHHIYISLSDEDHYAMAFCVIALVTPSIAL